MFATRPHQDNQASSARLAWRRRVGALCALPIASLLALTGCQGIVSTPTLSQIRIIDASPDAPGLDFYEGTTALAYNLGFGTITSYVPINPSTYTFSVKSAGTTTVLATAKSTLVSSRQYSILINDSSASLQETILQDQNQPAPSGQISMRFIDEASAISAVDVYLIPAGQKLTNVTPVYTNLTLSTNTGYLNVPIGTYTLVLVPTGTVPTSTTIATYTGAQVTYNSGAARTFILINQQLLTTPGVQVITADDYDSPTATS
ncbi:MAG: DUF4397 domain-containing protein [Acidobacteriota bacterium]|nr:DUF4397 domain-containing protein [Acidobacteriota bacterium]